MAISSSMTLCVCVWLKELSSTLCGYCLGIADSD